MQLPDPANIAERLRISAPHTRNTESVSENVHGRRPACISSVAGAALVDRSNANRGEDVVGRHAGWQSGSSLRSALITAGLTGAGVWIALVAAGTAAADAHHGIAAAGSPLRGLLAAIERDAAMSPAPSADGHDPPTPKKEESKDGGNHHKKKHVEP